MIAFALTLMGVGMVATLAYFIAANTADRCKKLEEDVERLWQQLGRTS